MNVLEKACIDGGLHIHRNDEAAMPGPDLRLFLHASGQSGRTAILWNVALGCQLHWKFCIAE